MSDERVSFEIEESAIDPRETRTPEGVPVVIKAISSMSGSRRGKQIEWLLMRCSLSGPREAKIISVEATDTSGAWELWTSGEQPVSDVRIATKDGETASSRIRLRVEVEADGECEAFEVELVVILDDEFSRRIYHREIVHCIRSSDAHLERIHEWRDGGFNGPRPKLGPVEFLSWDERVRLAMEAAEKRWENADLLTDDTGEEQDWAIVWNDHWFSDAAMSMIHVGYDEAIYTTRGVHPFLAIRGYKEAMETMRWLRANRPGGPPRKARLPNPHRKAEDWMIEKIMSLRPGEGACPGRTIGRFASAEEAIQSVEMM